MTKLIQDSDTPEEILEKFKVFDELRQSVWQPTEIEPTARRRRKIPVIVYHFCDAYYVTYDRKTEMVTNHSIGINAKLTSFEWWCFPPSLSKLDIK
jgi:hypothetical protein